MIEASDIMIKTIAKMVLATVAIHLCTGSLMLVQTRNEGFYDTLDDSVSRFNDLAKHSCGTRQGLPCVEKLTGYN